MTKQVKFGYPRRNIKGEFVTFRLGFKAGRDYLAGDLVELVDARKGNVLMTAVVVETDGGKLHDMATKHGHAAHNWLDYPAEQRPYLLMESMKKRYFPGRCTEESHTTVIRLKEVNNEQRTTTTERGTH